MIKQGGRGCCSWSGHIWRLSGKPCLFKFTSKISLEILTVPGIGTRVCDIRTAHCPDPNC
ncbi:hypothetical protein I7I48_05529 [Histoplasma ohiense]|nr:hypothetical protein I7I48_05529 [Histoplasma ohiense (nom. inval.)]